MKKIIFILGIALFCSCTVKNDGSETENYPNEIPVTHIYSFTYKNHSYIGFKKYYGFAVVHDPDCKYCYDKFD